MTDANMMVIVAYGTSMENNNAILRCYLLHSSTDCDKPSLDEKICLGDPHLREELFGKLILHNNFESNLHFESSDYRL